MNIQNIKRRLYIFFRSELSFRSVISNPSNYNRLFKGFNDKSTGVYDFKNNSFEDYLSDYSRLKTMWINGPYTSVLSNKIMFEEMCKHSLPVSKNIAMIHDGKISSIGNYKVNSFSELIDYLKEAKVIVIKPISGSGGAGILNIKYQDSNLITLNNKRLSLEELENLTSGLKDNFVNEYISQGKFGNELYANTMNTVRILTMKDPDNGEVFIPAAVQRIGTNKSHPTDTWQRGGMSCNINLETGELSKGAILPSEGKNLTWHSKHPDTGVQIEGQVIPNWEEIKKTLLQGVDELPFLTYVGWDLIVTNEGFRIIEGNSMSDVNVYQVHKPLLKDVRVKKFYEYHNVI